MTIPPAVKPTLLSDIAKAVRVPREYLRKIFQQLTKSRIVIAHRGVRGGYRLARNASEITLKDVMEAIAGFLPLYSCLSIRRDCGLGARCPVKGLFDKASRKMAEVLAGASIQDITLDIAGLGAERSWLKVTA